MIIPSLTIIIFHHNNNNHSIPRKGCFKDDLLILQIFFNLRFYPDIICSTRSPQRGDSMQTRSIPSSSLSFCHGNYYKVSCVQLPKCCLLVKQSTVRSVGIRIGIPTVSALFNDAKLMNKSALCFASRNGEQSASEEDQPEDKIDPQHSEPEDATEQVCLTDLDWRSFRAKLVAAEQGQKDGEADINTGIESKVALSSTWAHPISAPESGCLLVANDNLDESNFFQRSVVLLLKAGSSDNSKRPYGIILNRPLKKRMEDLKLTHPELGTIFSDCQLHFGGPVAGSVFLVTTEKNVAKDFEEVVPGLYFGLVNGIHRAAELVKTKKLHTGNFRFFLGYSCWDFEQLNEEIDLDYWHVAACSPNLITATSATNPSLWNEILQLMGGEFAELSRKPIKDSD